ncbi:calcineurin beta subunit [Nosema bombycis CQ1]|uniref:Calcineurin beta subunit n=1 Tax=Nosema bombycis (strain CQ1 / CVCC 102059) TaxID=578461 RepID=R0KP42_NOSB1|nr:calcineurin beta subunit [Nosema bombycis CQ1]|eukprot:EOB11942.1 calcineurin beta subunit [Nosema bombycis CQ1]
MDYEHISFLCFLSFLEIFHVKTDKSVRINFLFDIFDLHRDGRLCKVVLTRIYQFMGTGLCDNNEIEYVLQLYDKDRKGYLDKGDFINFYNSDPNIEKNLIIDFSKNLKQSEKIGFLDVIMPSRSKKKE